MFCLRTFNKYGRGKPIYSLKKKKKNKIQVNVEMKHKEKKNKENCRKRIKNFVWFFKRLSVRFFFK